MAEPDLAHQFPHEREKLTPEQLQIFLSMVLALGNFQVLQALHANGPLSLEELAKKTGIKPQNIASALRKTPLSLRFTQRDEAQRLNFRHPEPEKYSLNPQKGYLGEAVGKAVQTLEKSGLSKDELHLVLYPLRQQPPMQKGTIAPNTPVGILLSWDQQTRMISGKNLAENVHEQFSLIATSTVGTNLPGMIGDENNVGIFIRNPHAGRRRDQGPLELSPVGQLLVGEVIPSFAKRARVIAAGAY